VATESGRDTASLIDLLFEQPQRFEFFQAVRLLQKLAPDREPVGTAADPTREALWFRSDVSLSFPRTDLTRLERPQKTETETEAPPPELTVAFFGIASPSSFGSLPLPYAKAILDQERERSSVLRDFLDLFNERLIALFYRAWEKYRLECAYESGGESYFERALFGILGIATPGLRERLAVHDHALLSRAGLLAATPISAPNLASVIESYFQVPAQVRQFELTWHPIDPSEQTRLGAFCSRLGEDLYVGSSVRLCQSSFRVRLGPVGWDRYNDFIPSGPAFSPLFDLIRFAVAAELSYEVQLVLQAQDEPCLELSAAPTRDCRLGWSSWLLSPRAEPGAEEDADDAVFSSEGSWRAAPCGLHTSMTAWKEARA